MMCEPGETPCILCETGTKIPPYCIECTMSGRARKHIGDEEEFRAADDDLRVILGAPRTTQALPREEP